MVKSLQCVWKMKMKQQEAPPFWIWLCCDAGAQKKSGCSSIKAGRSLCGQLQSRSSHHRVLHLNGSDRTACVRTANDRTASNRRASDGNRIINWPLSFFAAQFSAPLIGRHHCSPIRSLIERFSIHLFRTCIICLPSL